MPPADVGLVSGAESGAVAAEATEPRERRAPYTVRQASIRLASGVEPRPLDRRPAGPLNTQGAPSPASVLPHVGHDCGGSRVGPEFEDPLHRASMSGDCSIVRHRAGRNATTARPQHAHGDQRSCRGLGHTGELAQGERTFFSGADRARIPHDSLSSGAEPPHRRQVAEARQPSRRCRAGCPARARAAPSSSRAWSRRARPLHDVAARTAPARASRARQVAGRRCRFPRRSHRVAEIGAPG